MSDVDATTLAEAARRYTVLRRCYWRFALGGVILLALLGALLNVLSPRFDPVVCLILIVPLVAGFLTCWVGCLATWLALMRFRCPGCGKRFLLSCSSSWPTAACKHCCLWLG
jgi:hypothetical protein